jgi:hypothetical protein
MLTARTLEVAQPWRPTGPSFACPMLALAGQRTPSDGASAMGAKPCPRRAAVRRATPVPALRSTGNR